MTNRLLKVLCMGALLCVSSPLRAQQEVDCAALATTLATGALQDIRAQEHAYTNIQLCPVAARATGMSRALERRKYVASFNDLNTEVFALVTRDKPVFDALVHMSGDRSASSTAHSAIWYGSCRLYSGFTPLESTIPARVGSSNIGRSTAASPGPLPALPTRGLSTVAPCTS